MAKIAKAVADSAQKSGKSRDLFSDLPEAAPRRLSGKATRASKPAGSGEFGYTARHIEVLEGLEPVRKRPGMYIGGVDERALHHLFAEVLDNSMDEAVAGYADRIEVEIEADGFVAVTDNGRGMPVDPHPKFPKKSALEIIMAMLHAGGKFSDKVYTPPAACTASASRWSTPLRPRRSRGRARAHALSPDLLARHAERRSSAKLGPAHNRRGTTVRFHPDARFSAKAPFKPARLFQMARSKAYLQRGVEIRWKCAPERITDDTPAEATFHFPNGLADFLPSGRPSRSAASSPTVLPGSTEARRPARPRRVGGDLERWPAKPTASCRSYCNTV